MDYIIVGAGIAGLYTAYSLHKKLGIKNMIVIEKSDRIGGRINTKYIESKNIYIEIGAGRIPSVHEKELKLVRELGLGDKIGEGGGGRSYIEISTVPTDKYVAGAGLVVPTIYQIDRIIPIETTDFYNILDILTKRLNDPAFYQIAADYSLYGLIEKFYGVDKAERMMYQFGYRDDFMVQNGVEGLLMFQKTFAPNTKFNALKGGLIQIIEKLAEYLEKNFVEIRLNTECIDISKNGDYECLLENGEKLYAKNIIFAIPKNNIMKIKYLEKIKDKLDSVVPKSLCRIYAFFPLTDGKAWFDNINTVFTTNTFFNQIIPIDKQKGLLMIYCDSINADAWNNLHEKNMLKQEFMFHLIRLFSSIQIPEPDEIYFSYYSEATHVWKACVDPAKMYKEIIHPIPGENIYIVGEAYSLTQQWTQGAIESVDDFLGLIGSNSNHEYITK